MSFFIFCFRENTTFFHLLFSNRKEKRKKEMFVLTFGNCNLLSHFNVYFTTFDIKYHIKINCSMQIRFMDHWFISHAKKGKLVFFKSVILLIRSWKMLPFSFLAFMSTYWAIKEKNLPHELTRNVFASALYIKTKPNQFNSQLVFKLNWNYPVNNNK